MRKCARNKGTNCSFRTTILYPVPAQRARVGFSFLSLFLARTVSGWRTSSFGLGFCFHGKKRQASLALLRLSAFREFPVVFVRVVKRRRSERAKERSGREGGKERSTRHPLVTSKSTGSSRLTALETVICRHVHRGIY